MNSGPEVGNAAAKSPNLLQQQEMLLNAPVLVILGLDGVQLLAASFLCALRGEYGKYSAQVAPSSCRAAVYVCTDGSADLNANLASAFRGA